MTVEELEKVLHGHEDFDLSALEIFEGLEIEATEEDDDDA